MNRYHVPMLPLAAAFAIAAATASTPARADLTIYDKDGWSVYTKGLIASHYQYINGDGDPQSPLHGIVVGGKFQTATVEDTRGTQSSVSLSRVRSGFIGTQLGFGINRQINDSIHVESMMAVSLQDVSSNRGQVPAKDVDFREAWAALVTPGGTLKFGRMFSIFGSASAPVVLMAYRYGVGNPCDVGQATISCASVGAGPLYAGFDAQFRYISPRFAGIELQLAVSDPPRPPDEYTLTPLPRVDGELNFDRKFGEMVRLRLFGQGLFVQPKKVDGAKLKALNVWGVMGTGVLDVANFSAGGGAWTGAGIGTRTILEAEQPDRPLSYDPALSEARVFRGFFGNISYDYHGTTIAAGGGSVFVRATKTDVDMAATYSILDRQSEWHVVLTHRIDTVVFTAEFMRWSTRWHFGEKQDINFAGAGANYYW